MARSIAYVGSTNEIELAGLCRYGKYLTDARVTLVVRDATGFDIAGPTLMRHIEGSNGDFVGGFSRTTPLTSGAKYVAIIDVDASGDHARWEMPFTAQTRKK